MAAWATAVGLLRSDKSGIRPEIRSDKSGILSDKSGIRPQEADFDPSNPSNPSDPSDLSDNHASTSDPNSPYKPDSSVYPAYDPSARDPDDPSPDFHYGTWSEVFARRFAPFAELSNPPALGYADFLPFYTLLYPIYPFYLSHHTLFYNLTHIITLFYTLGMQTSLELLVELVERVRVVGVVSWVRCSWATSQRVRICVSSRHVRPSTRPRRL
jgi:hypothetical protein